MLWRHAKTILISVTAILVLVGVLMVASNDLVRANNATSWWKMRWFMHVAWSGLGIGAILIVRRIPTSIYYRLATPILVFVIFLLLLTMTPLGSGAGGADRWLGVGPLRFQPSEVAKLGIVIYTAYYLASKEKYVRYFRACIPLFAFVGIVLGLVFIAPDLGTTLVLFAVFAVMLYVSRVPKVYLLGLGGIAAPLALFAAISANYRLDRILAFMNPWADPTGKGYQSIQASIAFARGGLTGVGYTQSLQKHLYLPESQTDFAFAILGEEFGLLGTSIVFLLFLLLFATGMSIAMKPRDTFRSLLAVGSTSVLCVPALLNISIATGLLPISGMPLPFVSYGGSSLIVCLAAIGLLLRIDKETSFQANG